MVDPVPKSANSALNDFMANEARNARMPANYAASNAATTGLGDTVARQAPMGLQVLDNYVNDDDDVDLDLNSPAARLNNCLANKVREHL